MLTDNADGALKRFRRLLFGLSILLMAVLMYCAPFMSDDFEFSSYGFTKLADMVDYSLHYGNGRLLGNVGNICLLASAALRIAAKAGVTAGILVLLPAVLGVKSRAGYLLSFLLFVGVAPGMFAQVYSWTSGFQNYVPSILLFLFCVLLFGAEDRGGPAVRILRAAGIFLCAVCAQLYVEHSSIVNLAAAVAALVLSWKGPSFRRFLAGLWVLGSAIGLAVMFLLPQCFETLYTFSTIYRRVYLGSLGEMLGAVYRNLQQLLYFFAGSLPLCLALGGGTFFLLRGTKAAWARPRAHAAAELAALVFVLYAVVNRVFFSGSTYVWLSELRTLVFALLCLAELFALVCAAAHLPERPTRLAFFLCAGLAVLSLAPLLVVSPIGERCVYQCYFFLSAMALLVFEQLWPGMTSAAQRLLGRTLAGVAALLAACLLFTFANIHWVDAQRTRYIEEQTAAGAEQINVCILPSDYVFYDGPWYFGTRYYRAEKHDIEFTFSDYASWSAQRRAEGWYSKD